MLVQQELIPKFGDMTCTRHARTSSSPAAVVFLVAMPLPCVPGSSFTTGRVCASCAGAGAAADDGSSELAGATRAAEVEGPAASESFAPVTAAVGVLAGPTLREGRPRPFAAGTGAGGAGCSCAGCSWAGTSDLDDPLVTRWDVFFGASSAAPLFFRFLLSM